MQRWHARVLLAVWPIAFLVVVVSCGGQVAHALVTSESGSVPVTAVVKPAPPTTQAVITNPQNDKHFTTTPLVISGSCGPNLLVRIFNNGVLAGSIVCDNTGQYVLNITLQIGKNVLSSNNYDEFEQAGPPAPDITVYVDTPVTPQSLKETETIAVNNPSSGDTPQALFFGTVFQPLGMVTGLGTFTVAASTNEQIDNAGQGAFVVASVFIADTALFNSPLTNGSRRLIKRFTRRP